MGRLGNMQNKIVQYLKDRPMKEVTVRNTQGSIKQVEEEEENGDEGWECFQNIEGQWMQVMMKGKGKCKGR